MDDTTRSCESVRVRCCGSGRLPLSVEDVSKAGVMGCGVLDFGFAASHLDRVSWSTGHLSAFAVLPDASPELFFCEPLLGTAEPEGPAVAVDKMLNETMALKQAVLWLLSAARAEAVLNGEVVQRQVRSE